MPQSLKTLSDEQLWTILHRPFVSFSDVHLQELTTLSKYQNLSDEEQTELERLVDQVDRYVLLRSQVLLLLKQRGYDVETRLKIGE